MRKKPSKFQFKVHEKMVFQNALDILWESLFSVTFTAFCLFQTCCNALIYDREYTFPRSGETLDIPSPKKGIFRVRPSETPIGDNYTSTITIRVSPNVFKNKKISDPKTICHNNCCTSASDA